MRQEQDNHTTKDSGYNGILKYIGIFGGVQGIVSVITLLKVAIVSHLLGPIGVGINEVYTWVSHTAQYKPSRSDEARTRATRPWNMPSRWCVHGRCG